MISTFRAFPSIFFRCPWPGFSSQARQCGLGSGYKDLENLAKCCIAKKKSDTYKVYLIKKYIGRKVSFLWITGVQLVVITRLFSRSSVIFSDPQNLIRHQRFGTVKDILFDLISLWKTSSERSSDEVAFFLDLLTSRMQNSHGVFFFATVFQQMLHWKIMNENLFYSCNKITKT